MQIRLLTHDRTPIKRQFLEDLLRVDSGADIVMNTGRPTLGPIEIYWAKGAYSQADFLRSGNFWDWHRRCRPDGDVVHHHPHASITTSSTLKSTRSTCRPTRRIRAAGLADKALATQILQRLINCPHLMGR